jgi:hypothetical protein
MSNSWISSYQYLQLAHCIWCKTADCPAQEYLSAQKDVFDIIDIRDTSSADGGPETEAIYNLKLETEDIGNKFIEVYKKSQQICKQCWKQHGR